MLSLESDVSLKEINWDDRTFLCAFRNQFIQAKKDNFKKEETRVQGRFLVANVHYLTFLFFFFFAYLFQVKI